MKKGILINLTPDEKVRLQELAKAELLSQTAFVRRKIFLKKETRLD